MCVCVCVCVCVQVLCVQRGEIGVALLCVVGDTDIDSWTRGKTIFVDTSLAISLVYELSGLWLNNWT